MIGMDEYIERKALRDALYYADAITMNGVKILNQFPSSDVAPVRHGRWIHTDYAIHWAAKDECSECTYHARDRDDLSDYNYCPNRGAKMDGE